jgi:hypothetical protein
MRLLRISLENPSVMCEIPNQKKSHYNATHFVLHQYLLEKVGLS